MLLTYKFRLCDKHAAELGRQAKAVNIVWNYANETQQKAVRCGRKWLSYCDLANLTSGSCKILDLHASTIQSVCRRYTLSRSEKKRPWLRWRGRQSLGWVPFGTGHVSFDGKVFRFRKRCYKPMHSRDLPPNAKIGGGSFSQDSKGHWYINCPVDIPTAGPARAVRVGIDLGLKDLVSLSDGRKVGAPRFYRKSEAALATAQRAKKSKRVRAVHAKIANRRKDFLHKLSDQLSKEYGLIIIGDVSPSKLAQTNLAKSVLDAGWSDLKRMLSYKSIRNGGRCLEVSEHMTTQTCSSCGARPPERPKGIAGLGIRRWTCICCGADQDRDVNAARNILARYGQIALAEGACPLGKMP